MINTMLSTIATAAPGQNVGLLYVVESTFGAAGIRVDGVAVGYCHRDKVAFMQLF